MTKNFLKSQSKIPYIFVAFFAVIIAINIIYIYLAKSTWRGVTTEDSYQKGLSYNEVLKQEKKQQELGWSIDSKFTQIGFRKASILVTPVNRDSEFIKDANISIFFRKPVQEGNDFIALPSSVGNAYRFEIEFPNKGQWDAVISVQKGDDKLFLAKRYVIQ
jgi:nitrogen fixation protein FixH